MERLLDEPVELGREAPVEPHVLAEEEEVRGPLVDSIGELAAALGDETLQPAEPPAACRSGFRLGLPPSYTVGEATADVHASLGPWFATGATLAILRGHLRREPVDDGAVVRRCDGQQLDWKIGVLW